MRDDSYQVGPTGIAASFNKTSWFLKGDVVSTDMRVLNNHGNDDIGLTGMLCFDVIYLAKSLVYNALLGLAMIT